MSPTYYEVLCQIHGVQQASVNYPHKCLTVGTPKNKQERRDGGCPRCKTEQDKQKSLN